jgi:hypothetical protein
MKGQTLNRRKFFTILGAGSAALAVKLLQKEVRSADSSARNNISDAKRQPEYHLNAGKISGKVVVVSVKNAVVDDLPVEAVAQDASEIDARTDQSEES